MVSKPGRREGRKAKQPAPLGNNINLLLQMQEKNGYLPRQEMINACRRKGIAGTSLSGVATFYSRFRFEKSGRHVLNVCKGTACHVKGAERIEEYVRELIGIRPGQTTKDGKFTLQRVNCLGACSKAPNIMINDVVYGELNKAKLKKVLGGLE